MFLTTLSQGRRETRELEQGTYIIGRGASCRIRFSSPDVSERHAILTVRDGRAILEDLHSANGTYVNGEAVERAVTLDSGMVVQIGENMLRVSDGEPEGVGTDASESVAEDPEGTGGGAEGADMEMDEDEPEQRHDPYRELRRSVQEQIQRELLKRMDMKKLTVQGIDSEGLEETARDKIHAIVDEVIARGRLPEGIDPVRTTYSTRPCASGRSKTCSPTTP